MSRFLCVVGMLSALWDIHPVNMSKSFAFILLPKWLSLSFLDHGDPIIPFLLFLFVFKNGFYLALKCSQKKQMREQLCQLNVY